MAEAGNLAKTPKRGYAAIKDNGLKLKNSKVKSFYYSRTFKHSVTNSTDMKRLWTAAGGTDEKLNGTYTDGFFALPYGSMRSSMTPDNFAELYRNFVAAKVTEYGCRIKSCAIKDTLVTKNATAIKVQDIQTEAGKFVVLHDQGNFFRQRRRMMVDDQPDGTGLLEPWEGVNRPQTPLSSADAGDMVDPDPDLDSYRRLKRVCWALPDREKDFLDRETGAYSQLGYPKHPPWQLESYCKEYTSLVGMGTSFRTNMPFIPMGPIDTPETLFYAKATQNAKMPWLGDAKITEWLDNKFPTKLTNAPWASYFAILDQESQIYGAQPPDFYLRLSRELHSESEVDRWAEIEVEYYCKGAGILPPQRNFDLAYPAQSWIDDAFPKTPWNKEYSRPYCPLTYHHLGEYERLYGNKRPEFYTQDDQEEDYGIGDLVQDPDVPPPPAKKQKTADPPVPPAAAEDSATTPE